jgi:pSer/pThr/pTyr-binding forkhead associated (FHA) protein
MVDKRRRVDLDTLAHVVKELGWRWPDAAGRRAKDPAELGARVVQANQKATLSVYSSGKLARKVEIESVPFSIGRSDANVLVISEQEVSRFHALIDRVDGRYVIEDHNSRNGLLVNHKRRDTAVLESGDVITIAHIDLVFSLDEVRQGIEDHGENTERQLAAFAETQEMPENSPVVVDFNRSQGK